MPDKSFPSPPPDPLPDREKRVLTACLVRSAATPQGRQTCFPFRLPNSPSTCSTCPEVISLRPPAISPDQLMQERLLQYRMDLPEPLLPYADPSRRRALCRNFLIYACACLLCCFLQEFADFPQLPGVCSSCGLSPGCLSGTGREAPHVGFCCAHNSHRHWSHLRKSPAPVLSATLQSPAWSGTAAGGSPASRPSVWTGRCLPAPRIPVPLARWNSIVSALSPPWCATAVFPAPSSRQACRKQP